MPLHNIRWRTVTSGVDEELVFANALEWLCGTGEFVEIEHTKSYHGSDLHIVSANLEKRGMARTAVARLGAETLQDIIDGIGRHIDEETKTIHIRLRLGDLLSGKVVLGEPGEHRCLKGQIKLQVYPGDDIYSVAEKLLTTAKARAERQGWPEPPVSGAEEE
ncbi:MAG: hypothetical protein HOE92_01945 [Euryarchaeota archaeon]|jgi:RNA binding exosome subunit|nr:hypothetical protein [Euryarchaeota archaeon]MBT3970961.1 hypothetical protein [Euryarchaeota archaeon]MBT4407850.1 hypothetical protein [Euryarchaeota archaeon]MBT6645127.1 hypothetical protein [Euryarchaeota archaeon]